MLKKILLCQLIVLVAACWLPGSLAAEPPGSGAVAYICLADKAGFADLQKAGPGNTYIVAYQGVALLDRNTEHPILMTQCYNLRLKKLVKGYFNWNQVIGIQILDPKIAL